MKNGMVVKATQTVAGDIDLINQYTRKNLTEDEVYTFNVVLCDNDIDRDYERFTVESLFSLQELFLGKTGIADHNPKSENQSARIYYTWVESVDGMKTQTGDDYFRLMAKAYVPICEGSKNFIDKIDTGIIKEVSVGCAVNRTICSVCGEKINSINCNHHKGEIYGDTLCYGELTEPTDAYEWSFVAVPAQRKAGVVKSFTKGEVCVDKIISCLKSEGDITLSGIEKRKLMGYISELEKDAENGRAYRENLMTDVKRFALLSKSGITGSTLDSIVKSLSIDELRELKSVYEKKAADFVPAVPQTYVPKADKNDDYNKFTI